VEEFIYQNYGTFRRNKRSESSNLVFQKSNPSFYDNEGFLISRIDLVMNFEELNHMLPHLRLTYFPFDFFSFPNFNPIFKLIPLRSEFVTFVIETFLLFSFRPVTYL
jgi:hypothetical protein